VFVSVECYLCLIITLWCFDTVGWITGRAATCEKPSSIILEFLGHVLQYYIRRCGLLLPTE